MKLIIPPSPSSSSLVVSLQHIVETLANTPDAGLPAGESVTIELDSSGAVIVTRQDGSRHQYRHPRARVATARQKDTFEWEVV